MNEKKRKIEVEDSSLSDNPSKAKKQKKPKDSKEQLMSQTKEKLAIVLACV